VRVAALQAVEAAAVAIYTDFRVTVVYNQEKKMVMPVVVDPRHKVDWVEMEVEAIYRVVRAIQVDILLVEEEDIMAEAALLNHMVLVADHPM
jgi:hypothetical protein